MEQNPQSLKCTDITCFNNSILQIDLDDLALEVLDQRLELAIVNLWGTPVEPSGPDTQCTQFTCTGFIR